MSSLFFPVVSLMVFFYFFFSLASPALSIRNVIVLIPDGTSVSHISLSRMLNKGAPLAIDAHGKGMMRTSSADNLITDSAAAGTAMAAGVKTNNGFISMHPSRILNTFPNKPPQTAMEKAKIQGKSIGLVVTSPVQHATPAAFTAHTFHRDDYEDIAFQQVKLGIDFVSGGGLRFLRPEKRSDKKDLLKELQTGGVAVAQTRSEVEAVKSEKLWALWAEEDLPYEIDRDDKHTPSLAEMTQLAIKRLSQNSKGFFLLVEGSKIDYASHANDAADVVHEFLAFDKAAEKAFEYAKSRTDTVVFVAPDHGNGGLSIGTDDQARSPKAFTLDDIATPLWAKKASNFAVRHSLKPDLSNLKTLLATQYGISQLLPKEEQFIRGALALANGEPSDIVVGVALGRILSARAFVGWTTAGHTGEDVPFFCFHPQNKCPTGLIDNTDMAKFLSGL